MKNAKKIVEDLQKDVINIVGNKVVHIKQLAQLATERKLTENEFESIRTQVDLCCKLVTERFLNELIHLEQSDKSKKELK